MTAVVAYLENALVPQNRRVEFVEPTTIRDLAPTDWTRPYVALLDGEPVLRADWEVVLEDDHSLIFIDVAALPQGGGGGGGGGGSDPLRAVLTIAVIVYAPTLAAELIFGDVIMAAAALGNVGMAVFGAAAVFAGMSLVNAVLPAPQQPSNITAAQQAAASPTYSLQAQGNTARLDSAVPEQFGRMLAYLDFAAQPYAEYAGNDQYLYQLLCVGRGHYDIEAVRIEDTAIDKFDDITYEVIQPGGGLTLFPANVVTSVEVSGQSLECFTGSYSVGSGVMTISATGHGQATGSQVYLSITSGGAASGAYTVASAPTPDTFTIAYGGSTSGSVTISPYAGQYVANTAGSSANYLGLDFIASRGLYYANDDGSFSSRSVSVVAEARPINDLGVATGPWTTLTGSGYTAWSDWTATGTSPSLITLPSNTPTTEYRAEQINTGVGGATSYMFYRRVRVATPSNESFSGATNTPQRYSLRYPVTPGRYEVRVSRRDVKDTSSRSGHEIVWGGLRAYLPDTRDYGDVTLIAMRMRASNNLSSQSSRKINVIATRKLPIWNGTTWSAPTATRSIAWALAYAAKQVGLTDGQLDLNGLLALNSTWAARGDYFDARFDGFISFWEAATKIAGAGRAKPYMQGGVLRLFRDQPATVPVALYSMRNIVKGSFNVEYLMPTPETADAVKVGYFDSTTWASATVQAKLLDSAAVKPVKVDLFGVTSRDQAYREGMYQAACNRYRRRIIRFTTDMEGFIPSYGDLVAIQHDMPAWGQSGEITDVKTSQNLSLYSQDLTNAYWGKVNLSSSAVDSILAPDGTYTAEGMVANTTNGEHYWEHNFTGYSPATSYVSSVFMHAGAGKTGRLVVYGTGNAAHGVSVDFATGVASLVTTAEYTSGGGVTLAWGATDVGDGWWRLYVIGYPDSAATNRRFRGVLTNSAGSTLYVGDGTTVQHYAWGMQHYQGTTLLPYVPTTTATRTNVTVLKVSEDLTWKENTTHYIGLRKRDGSVEGPLQVVAGAEAFEIVLASTPSITPYTGGNEERTHYSFGWSETWRQRARVLSVKPLDFNKVQLECVNEDDSVHSAETGSTTPAMPTSQLAGYTNAPILLKATAYPMRGNPNAMLLSWPAAAWATSYVVEQSSDGASWTNCGETGNVQFVAQVLYGKNSKFRVAAVGLSRGPWVPVTPDTTPPADVLSLDYDIEQFGIRLRWPSIIDLALDSYELRKGGTTWETAEFLATVYGPEYPWSVQTTGATKIWVKAADTSGNYSVNAASTVVDIVAPGAPALVYTLSGPDEVLSWNVPVSGFLVDRYELRYGANWASGTFVDTTKATSYRRKVSFSGSRTYWIAAIDAAGNVGSAGSVSVNITAPSAVTGLRTEVVDNNALIYWSPPASGSLPVEYYEARKGATWATATQIGSNGNSTFTTVFEQQSGSYTYWVAAVDSAGTVGTPISTVAAINQPPDYVLRVNINSDLSGTKVNAVVDEFGLVLPVNTTETWTDHFSNNGFATPQAQIDAGYPIYIQPSNSTASYVEYIDYGSVLPATNIVATLNTTTLSGTVTFACQIKYKLNSGDAWTLAPAGATSVLASNFRYVEITYTFNAASGSSLMRVNQLNIKLSVKQRNDNGSGTAAIGGTYVPFGFEFSYADTPMVQPNGSTPLIPVVIYAGGPNPTGFTVKLYNTAGTEVGGPFSWAVKGY